MLGWRALGKTDEIGAGAEILSRFSKLIVWKAPPGAGGGRGPMRRAVTCVPAGISPCALGRHRTALADLMDKRLSWGEGVMEGQDEKITHLLREMSFKTRGSSHGLFQK